MRSASTNETRAELGAVGLVAQNSPDYVRRFFELLERRQVVVPLRSADDRQRSEACGVERVVVPEPGHGWISVRHVPSDDPALAQVAFTSGTEGEPKGILLSHANLGHTVTRLIDVMGLDATIREYVGVPVVHSFGFGRCRAVAAVGGSCYLPAGGFQPREVAELLRTGQINAVSAVPSLWRIALRNAALFRDGAEHLRWIEIGSQPMPAAEKLALRELFPKARIVQHYGLTEASRATFLDISRASAAELESVGAPTGDVEIAIAQDGRIRIRGGNVAREILLGGRSVPNVDSEGWLLTSDLGELRGGYLHFLGRADEVINLAGIKVSPAALEERMRAGLDRPDRLCVVRVPDPVRGDGILLAAREDLALPDAQLAALADRALRELGVDARSSLVIARFNAFPATDSGKVQRRALAEEYLARRARTSAARGGAASAEGIEISASHPRGASSGRSVREVFARNFRNAEIRAEDTFTSLGGDSLSFIEVSVELEELLGSLPRDWQARTIGELETISRRRTRWHSVDMALFVRCVSIVAIVLGHFDVLLVGGATYLLLVVAGVNFARFQLPTVLATGSVRPILATAGRIAAPTALAIAVLQVKSGLFDPLQLALLGNWRDAASQPFGYWFLELMPQVFVIVALILLLPAARAGAGRQPFAFAGGLLAASAFVAWTSPKLFDAESLYYRVPTSLIWLFALGWALQVARTTAQRIAVAGLAALLPFALWYEVSDRFWLQHGALWVPAGCLALLLFERIRLPAPLHKIVAWIAGASMFIYLLHYTARGLWHRYGPVQHVWIDALVGILAGIAGWIAWESATRAATPWWRWLAARLRLAPRQGT
ncbi:MAG: AMP-binding protein [Planctomycetes bacterium]|nr:AMP-binding protein [Planctomycetota bacterium]